ncbi:MAG: GTPase Era [Candidatus Promineifilaceae bacterium]|nr:GTPase Era [Candidatus Promineifilaceae bacterium]
MTDFNDEYAEAEEEALAADDYLDPEVVQELRTLDEAQLPDDHKSGFVAVVGRPNVGKSTLMNALLQQKVAIVSPRPQTTRTRQLGIITRPDHQIIFIDTPGIMQPRHKLDEFMLDAAEETLVDSDLVLWLVDVSEPPGAGDLAIAEKLRNVAARTPVILAMNKADLLEPEEVLPRTEAYRALIPETENWLLFSAANTDGLEALYEIVLDTLPEGPRYYPAEQVTDLYMRDIAAEMVREQVLLQIREEIPHGVAVKVEEFKERETGVVYINATIFVERGGHKKIIIGSRGSQLREIGRAARTEIERMLGTRVYLDLWVKVEPNWRRNERALKQFGYAAPE